MFKTINKSKVIISIISVLLAGLIVGLFNSCGSVMTLKDNYKYHPLDSETLKFSGFYEKLMNFTKNNQLLNKDMWKQFVEVFRTKEDSKKSEWRCEYWGKTMRGAVLCYKYDQSDELYNVLEETVRDLLTTQDENGSFTTYNKDNEFHGWDIWGRKYIMTSLLGFLDICKDDNLKSDIIICLQKHADYIIKNIGLDKSKIDITEASNNWLGINSASILEPFVNLYEVTRNTKYLEFAKYIIETGGITSENGNLINIVNHSERMPFQYPEAKAYETMSFFEGVYRYALVTKDDYYKNTALKFFDNVDMSEISITGNAGTHEEQFSNTVHTQTVKTDEFCQETCVAVTWIRIMDLLYKTTGNIKYYENLNKTSLNAFLSCVNYFNQGTPDLSTPNKDGISYLPFDSYSPLINQKRGIKSGGFLRFNSPVNANIPYYGCCACIASAAVGLMSQNVIVTDNTSVILNDYFNGEIKTKETSLTIEGDYFGKGEVTIKCNSSSNKNLQLRIPKWVDWSAKVTINGEKYSAQTGIYYKTKMPLNQIKEITISFSPKVKKSIINDKVSLSYGDLVLGIDTEANPGLDLDTVNISDIDIKNITLEANQDDDLVRISAPFKGGNLILKSYCSCGKHWETGSKVTVFLNNI